MSAIQDAYEAGDADAYLTALQASSDFSALFEDGIDPAVEAGLRADFAADMLRQDEGFSFDKLGDIWNTFKTQGFGAAIGELMEMFNGAANPEITTLDRTARMGGVAAADVDNTTRAAYAEAIGIQGPGPGG